jgi:hypothetical protein
MIESFLGAHSVNSSKEIRLRRFKTLGFDLIFNYGGEKSNVLGKTSQKSSGFHTSPLSHLLVVAPSWELS